MNLRRVPVALCVILLSAIAAHGDDWPCWRGPQGTGVSAETNVNPKALQGGAKILWNVNVGYGYSSVVVKGNHFFTVGGDPAQGIVFWCLDAATGEVVWKKVFDQGSRYDNAHTEAASTPLVDGDRVYGIASDNILRCFRAADGSTVWEKSLPADFKLKKLGYQHYLSSSPVVEGNLLLLNCNTSGLALDKMSGSLVWRFDDPPGGMSSDASPVAAEWDGRRCAFFFGPDVLNVVDPSTGRKLWSFKHGDTMAVGADPVIFGDKVFLSGEHLAAYLVPAGADLKRVAGTGPRTYLSPPVLLDGLLFGTSMENFEELDPQAIAAFQTPFLCVDGSTGQTRWQRTTRYVSLAAAGDRLIMLELNGMLRIAQATPAEYTELSSADVLAGAARPRFFAAPPVISNGLIYCRNFAGDLVCIDVRS